LEDALSLCWHLNKRKGKVRCVWELNGVIHYFFEAATNFCYATTYYASGVKIKRYLSHALIVTWDSASSITTEAATIIMSNLAFVLMSLVCVVNKPNDCRVHLLNQRAACVHLFSLLRLLRRQMRNSTRGATLAAPEKSPLPEQFRTA
jgi:hypothetical protein